MLEEFTPAIQVLMEVGPRWAAPKTLDTASSLCFTMVLLLKVGVVDQVPALLPHSHWDLELDFPLDPPKTIYSSKISCYSIEYRNLVKRGPA